MLAAPSARSRARIVELDLRPFLDVARVRPDQDADPPQRGVVARAERGQPPPDEGDLLLGRGDRARGADVENVRLLGSEAEWLDERLPGRARVAREPTVEELRAGDDDVSRRRAVQLDGLALLALVPDEDAVGQHLDEPLRRELIPARDGEPDRNPQPARRLDRVGLAHARRGAADQRRHDHRIGRGRRSRARFPHRSGRAAPVQAGRAWRRR